MTGSARSAAQAFHTVVSGLKTLSADNAVGRSLVERLMDKLFQDLRFALRGARRQPAFALTAVITLALGIGATTGLASRRAIR